MMLAGLASEAISIWLKGMAVTGMILVVAWRLVRR